MERVSEERLAEIWSDKNSFTLNEAAALWVGESPPDCWIDDPAHPNFHIDRLPTSSFHNINAFHHMLERLQKAVGDNETGELKAKYFVPDQEYDDTGVKIGETNWCRPHPDKTIVSRNELQRWAATQGSFPLFLFSPGLKDRYLSTLESACLNEDYDYHSKELAIAIEAWHYFYHQGNIDPHKGAHVRQIKKWIEERFAADISKRAISNKAVTRIATMVNRYKKTRY